MTDDPTKRPRKETNTLNSVSLGPDFTYPSLPLDLSLDSLLAHSPNLASSSSLTMTKSETDTASLAESWTSLAETDISHEDDVHSEHTDVGSLLDVHSSDDIHSVIDAECHDRDPDPGHNSDTDEHGSDISNSEPPLPFSPWDRSGLHAAQSFSDLGNSFTEAQPSDSRSTVPMHYSVENSFNEQENRELRRHLPGRHYSGFTRMGLSTQGVDLNTLDYFKVILLGASIEQFRPEIQRKLGDVLVSQGGSSQFSSRGSVTRFHLVPNTFGPGAEPDFADLVAIDKQIDFDCYDQVEEKHLPHSRTSLCLKNRSTASELVSLWNGREFVVSQPRWISPDLAIVCVELDNAGKLDSSSHQMINFTERHQIPRIVIRMDRGWAGDYGDILQDGALLQSIQKRSDQPPLGLQSTLEFPVDIAAFLNLESTLLNKHIAFVVSRVDDESPDISPGLTPYPDELREWMVSKLPKNVVALSSTRHFVPVSIFSLTIITTSMIGLLLSFLLSSPMYHLSMPSTTTDQLLQNLSATAASSIPATLQVAQPSILSTALQSLAALARDDEAWQQQLESASVSRNEAMRDSDAHFQVGIASASQLMVKLPKAATTSRKRSVLDVSLKRGDAILPMILQELFDGVYSVTLEPHDSYGDVEVKLSMSNPQVTEVLTLSFGERSLGKLDRVKTAFDEVKSRARRTLACLTGQLAEARDDVPMHRLFHNLSVIGMTMKAHLRKVRVTLPAADMPHDGMELGVRSWVVDRLKMTGAEIRQVSWYGLLRGQQLLKAPLNGFNAVRSATLGRLEDLKGSGITQQMRTKVVVNGLACAQDRAQQVVSRAANGLRGLRVNRKLKIDQEG